jgi:hypothetical protein
LFVISLIPIVPQWVYYMFKSPNLIQSRHLKFKGFIKNSCVNLLENLRLPHTPKYASTLQYYFNLFHDAMFQDKVKIKDLKIGAMVYVSLHYNDFKRMWEATSLEFVMHKPPSYEVSI